MTASEQEVLVRGLRRRHLKKTSPATLDSHRASEELSSAVEVGPSYHDGSNAVLRGLLCGTHQGATTQRAPFITLGPLVGAHCTPLHPLGDFHTWSGVEQDSREAQMAAMLPNRGLLIAAELSSLCLIPLFLCS